MALPGRCGWRPSEGGEELVGPSGESSAGVLRGGHRCGGHHLAGAFDVAVGAAGAAEVGVVELAERSPERCLEALVDVVRDREPLFGLLVVAEEGGCACERPGDCA